MHLVKYLLPLAGLGFAAVPAIAQTPIVYPAKGQTAEQQQKDSGECAAWAKQTTGIDPVALASAPPPASTAAPAPAEPTGPQGERLKGAARGAAAGAIAGEIANDDASSGAEAGAVVGAVAGGSRARREQRKEKEQAATQQTATQQQAEAQKQQQLDTYNRANAACLEGRGYVLK